ncbi:hypothetical protein QJS10_CPA10g01693 [Acorus calamus]|uniref:3'-5' exonuclease domain-containing protein n=1 Tax=Acorus calamus TaxID=4465 RepID=A0AAV9DYD1_ACOCL|nr:hypothetical protein QJS10_CPA10g01693 [Acorus calamus]
MDPTTITIERSPNCPNIFRVHFYDMAHIATTITKFESTVSRWIHNIQSSHAHRLYRLIVGLDIEWRPNLRDHEDNPVALLQLCVGQCCLVFQILHCPHIPDALYHFLADPRFTFVGVGIDDDVRKLRRNYNLNVVNTRDLREMAVEQVGRRELGRFGLKRLAKEFLGKDVEKPRWIQMGDWDEKFLILTVMTDPSRITIERLSDYTFTVHFFNEAHITTTVTTADDVVTEWVNHVFFIQQQHGSRLIVGLDIDWRPKINGHQDKSVAMFKLCISIEEIYYSETDFIVHFFDVAHIATVVTASSVQASLWVYKFLYAYKDDDANNNDNPTRFLVGLDVKWRTEYGHQHNPVEVLQLCVEQRCLIFQICRCDAIPNAFSNFLSDTHFTFAGININESVRRLILDYNVRVGNIMDIRTLKEQVELRRAGLRLILDYNVRVGNIRELHTWLEEEREPIRLKREGRQLDRDILIWMMQNRMSVQSANWDEERLSLEHIMYPCMDSFIPFQAAWYGIV